MPPKAKKEPKNKSAKPTKRVKVQEPLDEDA